MGLKISRTGQKMITSDQVAGCGAGLFLADLTSRPLKFIKPNHDGSNIISVSGGLRSSWTGKYWDNGPLIPSCCCGV